VATVAAVDTGVVVAEAEVVVAVEGLA